MQPPMYTSENDMSDKIKAVLRCVEQPDEQQLEGFRKFLAGKYKAADAADVELDVQPDSSLGGGFILDIGSDEYDWSVNGRAKQVADRIDAALAGRENPADRQAMIPGEQAAEHGIMSILRAAADDFRVEALRSEVGTVLTAGDGIVTIDGLAHVMYGEILLFDNGVKGMVQNIEADCIGAILFDEEGTIGEGTKVVGTGKRAGIPVGEEYLGRVINALGSPIDGGAAIPERGFRSIEQPAPGIIDRQPVTVPLETGILAIDSMFPIGRGQRELIIGDRQTGKTSIALDTILNQKGRGCICVYVAIGQKASTIASLVETLRRHEAMEYSIVVSSTASDPAPLQYIAPYAATSLAEYFMHKGKDVLIVYDDLSKHAVAYRALSLLLGRSPGREAYPGDVFYLHSRLLERSARLSEKLGGGSITALPIIETQDGDVAAYIPTNVISITDGQIFLESDLFFAGQRPAVNVGLSVSRVGGAAQTKAMKKAAGSLRIDLAQFREMEVFTQFASDLDEATTNQLRQGKILMEMLKQPLEHPLSPAREVVTLWAAQNRRFLSVEPSELGAYCNDLFAWFEKQHPELLEEISRKGKLEKELQEELLKAVDEFRSEQPTLPAK